MPKAKKNIYTETKQETVYDVPKVKHQDGDSLLRDLPHGFTSPFYTVRTKPGYCRTWCIYDYDNDYDPKTGESALTTATRRGWTAVLKDNTPETEVIPPAGNHPGRTDITNQGRTGSKIIAKSRDGKSMILLEIPEEKLQELLKQNDAKNDIWKNPKTTITKTAEGINIHDAEME